MYRCFSNNHTNKNKYYGFLRINLYLSVRQSCKGSWYYNAQETDLETHLNFDLELRFKCSSQTSNNNYLKDYKIPIKIPNTYILLTLQLHVTPKHGLVVTPFHSIIIMHKVVILARRLNSSTD